MAFKLPELLSKVSFIMEPHPKASLFPPCSNIEFYFSSPSLFIDKLECELKLQQIPQTAYAILHMRKKVLFASESEMSTSEWLPLVSDLNAGTEESRLILQFPKNEPRVCIVSSSLYLCHCSTHDAAETVLQWLQRVAHHCFIWNTLSAFVGYARKKKKFQISRSQFKVNDAQGVAEMTGTFLKKGIRARCTLSVQVLGGNIGCVRFTVRNKESDWSTITQNWKLFLDRLRRVQLDFGWVTITQDKFSFTAESLLDFTSVLSSFAKAFLKLTSNSLGDLSPQAMQKDQANPSYEIEIADLIEEKPCAKPGLDYEEQYDSSRNRIVLRALFNPKTSYEPTVATAKLFLPYQKVVENSKTYIEVDLQDWVKVYKQHPLDVSAVEKFVMDLCSCGLCFKTFPWRATYWKTTAPHEIRLVPRVIISDTIKPPDDRNVYQHDMVESWLKFLQQKSELGALTLNQDIAKMELAPTAFKFTPIDSPNLIIGKGGFGVVYINTLGSEAVAVKGYSPSREYNQKAVDNEIDLMKKLNHPNIVKIYGVTQYKNRKMIVLEKCENSLAMFVKKYKRLPDSSKMSLKTVLALLRKIASAISYLHGNDICHFDLKPQNILMKTVQIGGLESHEPKLSDFGMASKQKLDRTWRKPGYTIGYSAPEQLQGCIIGPHCDVWAFAMVAYYLIFEQGPYDDIKLPEDKNEKKKVYLREICQNWRKPKINPTFEKENSRLSFLLRQCWQSNPLSRPKMNEVVRRLKEIEDLDKE